jgi:hypothetical protein
MLLTFTWLATTALAIALLAGAALAVARSSATAGCDGFVQLLFLCIRHCILPF